MQHKPKLWLPVIIARRPIGELYERGASSSSGRRYACTVRGPDGAFWLFDDQRPPRRLEIDVAEFSPHDVAIMVYVPSADLFVGGGGASHGAAIMATVAFGVMCEKREPKHMD